MIVIPTVQKKSDRSSCVKNNNIHGVCVVSCSRYSMLSLWITYMQQSLSVAGNYKWKVKNIVFQFQMVKLQPRECEICDVSNCTGVGWITHTTVYSACSLTVFEKWTWSSSKMLSIPLDGWGEKGEDILHFSADPETQRIGWRIEKNLTDRSPALELQGT